MIGFLEADHAGRHQHLSLLCVSSRVCRQLISTSGVLLKGSGTCWGLSDMLCAAVLVDSQHAKRLAASRTRQHAVLVAQWQVCPCISAHLLLLGLREAWCCSSLSKHAMRATHKLQACSSSADGRRP